MRQPSIKETIEFIKLAHAGQTDWQGLDYYNHPISVMNRLPADATDDEKRIALLHDVIEDTKYTADDLRERGYSEYVVQGVILLSRNLDENITYLNKIKKIVQSGHKGAMRVKLADNQDNSCPIRNPVWPEEKKFMLVRYHRSMEILERGLKNLA